MAAALLLGAEFTESQEDNGGAGGIWSAFCPSHDAWKDAAKRTMRNGAATTTSSTVSQRVGGGTTSK
jgi:hypothetical protein